MVMVIYILREGLPANHSFREFTDSATPSRVGRSRRGYSNYCVSVGAVRNDGRSLLPRGRFVVDNSATTARSLCGLPWINAPNAAFVQP
jgi:hypothetical protein